MGELAGKLGRQLKTCLLLAALFAPIAAAAVGDPFSPEPVISFYHGTSEPSALEIMTKGVLPGKTRVKDPVLGDGFYAFRDELDADSWAIVHAAPDTAAVVKLTMPKSLYDKLTLQGLATEAPWSQWAPDIIQVRFKPAAFAVLNSPAVVKTWKKFESGGWSSYSATT